MCDVSNKEQVESMKSDSDLIQATLQHLARINGEINRMSSNELTERLKYYGLDIQGNDDVRRRRLKNMYKKIKLASININISDKLLPYYVLIDFEATCLDVCPPNFQHEIIEFPAVLVNSVTQEIKDTFQMYCKPVINPKLSDFCIQLTGITQDQVDSAKSFGYVLQCFEKWLQSHELGKKNKFVVVTDTPWDMSKFLFHQCQYSGIPYPKWGKKWVNLKRAFSSFYKCNKLALKGMLSYLGMEFEGNLHCGLDDAKNIGRVLIKMIKDGANIQANEKIIYKGRDIRAKWRHQGNETGNKDKKELNEKVEDLRIQVYFTVIENSDQLLTYEKVKKLRGKMQAKMNRKLKEKCDGLENVEEMAEILEWMPQQQIRSNKKHKRKWKKLDLAP